MRDSPQELVFALVFGAVWLAQRVYKLVRRKAAALQRDAATLVLPVPEPTTTVEAESEVLAPPLHPRPTRHGLPARAADPPKSIEVPGAAPAAQAAQAVPAADRIARRPARPISHPLAHRFSKAALMPSRREVQDAIVIAAILQPCHAQRPHDLG